MGLFDLFTKTPAERQAAKEADERRKLEKQIRNSTWAQDVDKEFDKLTSGTYSEPKGRGGHIIWRPQSSEAGNHTKYQEHDKSGGSSNGATSSETPQIEGSMSRVTTGVESVVSGKLGEEQGYDGESGENTNGDRKHSGGDH